MKKDRVGSPKLLLPKNFLNSTFFNSINSVISDGWWGYSKIHKQPRLFLAAELLWLPPTFSKLMKLLKWQCSAFLKTVCNKWVCKIIKHHTTTNCFSMNSEVHTGAKIYPKITKNLMFEKCEFCVKWDFENVNFVEKMRIWNCEFCEKWDSEIVIFVKNEISKMWILWKVRFQIVNFWINWGFSPQCKV